MLNPPDAMPLLSVVMPVFNGAAFLADAIATVQRTDLPLELIVVDDGSTDGSAAIAQAATGLIYIRQENAGPAAARNRALHMAKGEFLAFLDADDLWSPGHPHSAVQYLAAHPDIDVALTRTQCILTASPAGNDAIASGKPFHSYQIGAAVVRRRLIQKIGGFDAAMRHGEDVDWFLRMRESGAAITTLAEVGLLYRLHPGNQPTIYRKSREGLLNAFHQSLQRRRTMPPPNTNRARPLVSVIIPVFNGERFIAEAIESVVAQDYRPLELVVVDDGSTDRTRDVVQQFPQATLLARPHQGAGAARNAGVRAGGGEFLAFLDADDTWHSNKLSRQMERLMAQPDLEAVFSHTLQYHDGKTGASEVLASPTPATMLVRRNSFERIGWFSEEPNVLEGVDWSLRANENGLRTEMLPDVLYRRRIHTQNRSIVNRNLRGYLRAIKASLDRRREHARAQ